MSPLRSLGNTLSSFKDFYSRTGKDASGPPPNTEGIELDILLIAGAGSGGGSTGGGGGAGGILHATSLRLTSGGYVFNVGAGGASVSAQTVGNNGSNTTFGDPGTTYLTAIGGGGGASGSPGATNGTLNGKDGGSGGGGSYHPGGGDHDGGDSTQTNTWSGPSPSIVSATITAYGNDGGDPGTPGAGEYKGGGGAGGAVSGVPGGAGQPFPVVSGSNFPSTPGVYGVGGDGTDTGNAGDDGADNTGNGGEGGWAFANGTGGAGGSGVAFLIVPDTNAPYVTTPAPSSPAGDSSSRTVFKFTSTGPTAVTIS